MVDDRRNPSDLPPAVPTLFVFQRYEVLSRTADSHGSGKRTARLM